MDIRVAAYAVVVADGRMLLSHGAEAGRAGLVDAARRPAGPPVRT